MGAYSQAGDDEDSSSECEMDEETVRAGNSTTFVTEPGSSSSGQMEQEAGGMQVQVS